MNEYKILFLGSINTVAKTSLCKRIVYNTFNERTIVTSGAELLNKIIQTKFGEIKLKLWDAAGQDRFKTISILYMKDSKCIILGYDVTDRESFESIKGLYGWYNIIKDNIDINNVLIYLVGNKIDLVEKRVISDEEGKSLANDLNMKYFSVSAKTGEGVDILLDDIVNSLLNKFPIKKSKKEDNKKNANKDDKK